MALGYINSFAIIIILIVLGIHIIYTIHIKIKHENNMRYIQNQINDIKTDFEKLNVDIIQNLKKHAQDKTMSLLDLDEFSKLDPFVKDLYRNYIVDQIMPAIMKSINDQIKISNFEQQYTIYKKEIDEMVAQIVNEIRINGIESLMKPSLNQYDNSPPILMTEDESYYQPSSHRIYRDGPGLISDPNYTSTPPSWFS